MFNLYRIGVAPTPNNGDTPRSSWQDWVWPVPVFDGRMPKISDGFGRDKRDGRGHFGVDIMHVRQTGDDARELKVGKQARGHVIFEGEQAVSAGPGKVYETEKTATGHTVKVSHRVDGAPILSVYRHLLGSNVQKGMLVAPGFALGPIGDNPSDAGDPPHLHFELWDTSSGRKYPDWNFDPYRVMKPWGAWVPGQGRVDYNGPTKFKDDSPDTPKRGGGGGILVAVLAAIGVITAISRKG